MCDTVTHKNLNLSMTLGRRPGSKRSKRTGTSSSVHVHHLYTSRTLNGCTTVRQEVLNSSAIHKRQAKDREDHALRQEAMTTVERDELDAIRNNVPENGGSGSLDNDNLEHNAWEMEVDTILAGQETMDISHAGGEFTSVVEIAEDLLGTANR